MILYSVSLYEEIVMYYFLHADIIQVQREYKAKGAKVYVCVKDVT